MANIVPFLSPYFSDFVTQFVAREASSGCDICRLKYMRMSSGWSGERDVDAHCSLLGVDRYHALLWRRPIDREDVTRSDCQPLAYQGFALVCLLWG